jgi:RNA polymerase sigma-70 factor (ECF subfamily)
VAILGRELLSDADDRTIASRAADGDVRAFEVLMRRYGALISTYAFRILGNSADTDDVVQEAFISAWQDLPTLENYGAVQRWLITVVTRKSIDRVNARRDHDAIDDAIVEDPSDTPDVLAAASSLEQALSRALSDLPEDQRRCWVLREVGGYGYTEIAEQLDLPVSTVRGLLARSRKALVREMEAWR